MSAQERMTMHTLMLRITPWLIPLLAAAVYFPAVLTNDFVSLDDPLLITQNPTAQGLSVEHVIAAFTTYDPELYIPLTLLTYQIEWSLFGPNPVVFHLTNLILHLASTVLVFAVFRRLAAHGADAPSATAIGMLCAAVFALHPLSAQMILWAAARKDALAVFFFLLSILLYLRYRETLSSRAFVSSVLAFGLGLLAKVSIVLLPMILVGIDLQQGRALERSALRDKIPYLMLSGVFGVIALFGKGAQIVELGFVEKLLLSAKATALYLQKLFIPIGLSVFYPQQTPITITQPDVRMALVCIAGLAACLTWAIARGKRSIAFGIAWYAVLLLPSFLNFWKNGFVYVGDDRYGVVPIIGITFSLASGATAAFRRMTPLCQRVAWGMVVLLTVAMIALSVQQRRVWHDSVTLYEHVLRFHPDSAHAWNNLGTSLSAMGDRARAEEAYLRAIAENPHLPQFYVNMGKLAYDRGDRESAEEWFRRGIAAIPQDRMLLEEDLSPYAFLGALLEEQGRLDEALAAFAAAADRGPSFPTLRLNQAIMLHKYRRLPEARSALLQYVEQRPRDLAALYRIAAIEGELGLIPEAVAHLETVVARDPDYEQAAEHLRNMRRMLQ